LRKVFLTGNQDERLLSKPRLPIRCLNFFHGAGCPFKDHTCPFKDMSREDAMAMLCKCPNLQVWSDLVLYDFSKSPSLFAQFFPLPLPSGILERVPSIQP
jgi:hypothetical protein